MRIAHIDGFAGVAWRLARAQERLGHETTVFSLRESPYRFPYDVRLRGTEGPLGWNAAMFANWKTFAAFDVLHVHGGIWRSQFFYPIFKRSFRWKTLAVHFHGSETRTGKGLHYLASADLLFRSTQDLAAWLPQSEWVPNPIDLPELPPDPGNPRPRFGHFVSSPENKGTRRILALFQDTFGPLEKETAGHVEKYRGREAELWVVSGVPHEDALRIMTNCDAIIDQFSDFDSYGVVAIEAMAFGKPVFGTVRMEWYPGCPVIPLRGTDAGNRLRDIARDAALRKKCGLAGRAYVERVHESGKVARQVLKAYYRAKQVPPITPSEAIRYWRSRGRLYEREFRLRGVRTRYDAQLSELLAVLDTLSFRSVAEVGCGFGRVGQNLVDKDRVSWVGLDVSRAQLEAARRHRPSLKATVLEASASALPLRTRSADLVLSVELLMHIPPDLIEGALREMLRVTRSLVVHLDWYEDFLVGHQTGWCWVHDYPVLWRSLGADVREVRLRSNGIQSIFIVRAHMSTDRSPSAYVRIPSSIETDRSIPPQERGFMPSVSRINGSVTGTSMAVVSRSTGGQDVEPCSNLDGLVSFPQTMEWGTGPSPSQVRALSGRTWEWGNASRSAWVKFPQRPPIQCQVLRGPSPRLHDR